MILKPYGERIVIAALEEDAEYAGQIVLPAKRQRDYRVGKCVAVGNGKNSLSAVDDAPASIYTKVDDVYLFQVDDGTLKNCSYVVNGQKFVFLHQADMIAKLNDKNVTMESIDAVGHWIFVTLVNRFKPGVIIVPETVSVNTAEPEVHFVVEKVGNAVPASMGLEKGVEIALARSRLTTIQFGTTIYGFISDNFVYGSVNSD